MWAEAAVVLVGGLIAIVVVLWIVRMVAQIFLRVVAVAVLLLLALLLYNRYATPADHQALKPIKVQVERQVEKAGKALEKGAQKAGKALEQGAQEKARALSLRAKEEAARLRDDLLERDPLPASSEEAPSVSEPAP